MNIDQEAVIEAAAEAAYMCEPISVQQRIIPWIETEDYTKARFRRMAIAAMTAAAKAMQVAAA